MNDKYVIAEVLFATVCRLAKSYSQLDPDDLAQTVAVKLLGNYSRRRRIPERWLRTVIRTTACDMYRKQRREERFVDISMAVDNSGDPQYVCENRKSIPVSRQASEFSSELEEDELIEHIMREIRKLPEQQQAAFIMFADGASYSEIAERTGVKMGTVRSRLHYARLTLQSRLAEVR